MNEIDVSDARERQRFLLPDPLPAVFLGVQAVVLNIGSGGVQIEHADPVKLGVKGRLTVTIPRRPEPMVVQAHVRWSHLSRSPNKAGKYLYRSGLEYEEGAVGAALFESVSSNTIVILDRDSIDKKKKLFLQRVTEKEARPIVKPIGTRKPEIDPDQLLMIRHAREQLRLNPDEAAKWYNRAKFSLADAGVSNISHREDVLAVWEYLERSIDLAIIAKVFEENIR
jgi:hypothetical protein